MRRIDYLPYLCRRKLLEYHKKPTLGACVSGHHESLITVNDMFASFSNVLSRSSPGASPLYRSVSFVESDRRDDDACDSNNLYGGALALGRELVIVALCRRAATATWASNFRDRCTFPPLTAVPKQCQAAADETPSHSESLNLRND